MLILKGFFIGIGKIIPGVSGSLIAISLNVYENALYSITNFFEDKKENFMYLFKLAIGILISLVFFSKVIVFLLNNYFVETMMLFIGFIFSSMSELNYKISKSKIRNKMISFVFFVLVIYIGLITNNHSIINNNINFFYLFLSGVIESFSMIVPGISGTALLMMLGTYEHIILTYSNIFDFGMFIINFTSLFPFFIGILFGAYFTIKLINYLFSHYKSNTYSAIKGFSYASIVLMWLKCKPHLNFTNFISGTVLLILGYFCMKKINQIIK